MILTVAQVMLLTLMRDRGALAMVFVLPPAIFVVFAAIFSETGQGDPDLRLGLAMLAPDPAFQEAFLALPSQSVRLYDDASALRLDIAEGGLDGGLLLRGSLTDLDQTPLVVLVDPGKRMAGAVLEGRVRALLAAALPEVMIERQARGLEPVIGALTVSQGDLLDLAIAQGAGLPAAPITLQERVGEPGQADPTVSYYAGAIAIMFLLFSATQTAAGLIDERRSGILDRFAAGPGGIDVVVLGKATFLVLQGFVQGALVFVVAALFYGVPVWDHWLGWLGATLLAAAAASGLGLFCAAACTTRAQAVTVSNFVVLTFSALGGSMVPRFLMPDWLRNIGAATPNAWAVDLYQGLLIRDLPFSGLLLPMAALAALALLGITGAVLLSRQRMQL